MPEENAFFVRTKHDDYEYRDGLKFELERKWRGWREVEESAAAVLRNMVHDEENFAKFAANIAEMREETMDEIKDGLRDWMPSVSELLDCH